MNHYMEEFKSLLDQLTVDERTEVTHFYQEYLQDGHFDSYNACVKELGTPRQLARKILADYSIKASTAPRTASSKNQRSKNDVKTIWLILLALFSSPVAIPLIVVAGALLVAVIAVASALIISLIAIFFAAVISGLWSAAIGVSTILIQVWTGLFYLGIGLSFIGILVMLVPTFKNSIDRLIHKMTLFSKWLYDQIIPKNQAEKKRRGYQR